MTKRKKRAWWKQKSERIAQHRFGAFRTSLASRRSSFVLEPDYADIYQRGCDLCHQSHILSAELKVLAFN